MAFTIQLSWASQEDATVSIFIYLSPSFLMFLNVTSFVKGICFRERGTDTKILGLSQNCVPGPELDVYKEVCERA